MARSSAVVARCSERRMQPRHPGARIRATLRVRGRWGRHQVSVVDFNRHGMSILIDRPLEAPKGLCIALACEDLDLPELRAVLHNCRSTRADGVDCYRLGIQFRADARDQFDRVEAERILAAMEQLAETS